MAGHSHWKQTKYKKAIVDAKKGKIFSKLIHEIMVAAQAEPNPEFNPRLRQAIEKAKQARVPQENIKRAIEKSRQVEELILEGYGPEGVGLIVQVTSTNKQGVLSAIKKIFTKYQGKLVDKGGVSWAFDSQFQPKFLQKISESGKNTLQQLISELNQLEEVKKIITNAEN